MKRILYYSPHPHLRLDAPTGYGTHMREMIAAWRRAGHEVRTLIAGDNQAGEYGQGPETSSKIKQSLKKYLPAVAWETFKDLSLMRYDAKMESELSALINEFQPDLIYERVAYIQNSGVKVADNLNIPHIAEVNAPFPEERLSFSGRSLVLDFAKNIEREFLVKSTGLTVVSSALKNYLVSILPEAEKKIHVIPNSVNPHEKDDSYPDVEVHKARMNLKDEIVIGFVGSIFPYHGVDILIRAFAKLPKDLKIKLLIVGDGEMLPELRALARSLGVFDNIIFSGSVPHREVYSLIELMDICCMARSNWYGSPVKIFEYALLKKPVIAPDVGPVRDVMSENEGILVGPDEEEMKEALLKLINDEALRATLAENWQKKVLENYTWDHAAQKTLELCLLP